MPVDQIQSGSAMVELKDEEGELIRRGIVGYRDIYHLATVTVVGTLREEGGNYFLDANRLHVNSKTPLDVATTERKKDGGG